jgi:hypothetical protein
MPAHVSKSVRGSWKEFRTVETGEIYPVVYKDDREGAAQEIGRLLMVHCPDHKDEVEVVACPTPEDLPNDERQLTEFYEIQRHLARLNLGADNYVRSFKGPELFYAKLKSLRSGIFDLLIRHIPDA